MKLNRALFPVVKNRIPCPSAFVAEMLEWSKTAPLRVFEMNENPADIFGHMRGRFGPWNSVNARRGFLLAAMIVLAGWESSWDWNEGRDTSNPDVDTPEEIEAGAFQVSANSMNFGPELREAVRAIAGKTDPESFQHAMKTNHPLALTYIAMLLRRTVRHNGPVRDRKIVPAMKPELIAAWTMEAAGVV